MLGLVCIKRVVDYAVKVQVAADKSGVDLSRCKMSMNPFCEIAVEEGIRLKEKNVLKKLVAVTVGTDKSQDIIRQALAMGADHGILIRTDLRSDRELQPLGIAKLIQYVIEKQKAKLVLLGKQAIDDDYNQTSQILGGLMGWSQATFASKVDFSPELNKVTVQREVDQGLETIETTLPAIISCDLRLNDPRYATLPNLMKAKKKSLEIIEATSLGIDFAPRLSVMRVEEPKPREQGVIVKSVDDLLERLRKEANLNI